uniref:Ubiquitin-conjugating enzyme E2 Z n=1 Tax=Zosterops lateralis melanops TaxID=1220523 RepID=A0A8D2PLN7_ZOSLA
MFWELWRIWERSRLWGGGFFLFLFRCPPDYPIHPPRVKLITTGNNSVRFNPNFYRNGKVCLSILGTGQDWSGPGHKNYNECIRHETIRVAVCDMLEGKCPCPEPLRGVMEKSFMEYFDFYEGVCKERLHLQGQTMQDPFGEKRGHFDYQSLLGRLQGIWGQLQEWTLLIPNIYFIYFIFSPLETGPHPSSHI